MISSRESSLSDKHDFFCIETGENPFCSLLKEHGAVNKFDVGFISSTSDGRRCMEVNYSRYIYQFDLTRRTMKSRMI